MGELNALANWEVFRNEKSYDALRIFLDFVREDYEVFSRQCEVKNSGRFSRPFVPSLKHLVQGRRNTESPSSTLALPSNCVTVLLETLEECLRNGLEFGRWNRTTDLVELIGLVCRIESKQLEVLHTGPFVELLELIFEKVVESVWENQKLSDLLEKLVLLLKHVYDPPESWGRWKNAHLDLSNPIGPTFPRPVTSGSSAVVGRLKANLTGRC
ncbi:hypothetical protein P879_08307 [Paragonimus westermani]|uniref:Uncharacterized protein n=1 Tax=Paragonimus westermani TaxID=34504 RepID=A0A8T0D7M4_9TREM|nr:hypothetical protein P879_08307 [Paragonimus westermani]